MRALVKYSILPVLAIPVGVYFYDLSNNKIFYTAQPRLDQQICERDGDRLAQLQSKPSLEEALRFGSELRCEKLWPQLSAFLDSLSHAAGPAVGSSTNGAALDVISAGGATPLASSSAAMEATSATSDDACNHDEGRLAELQANPSIEKAMRVGSELRCSKLRPRLLAILDSLGHTRKSAEASKDAAPANSAGGAAQPAALPALEATSTACRYDEDLAAEPRAKPSIDEDGLFGSKLRCAKALPSLLAMLNILNGPAHSTSPSPPDFGSLLKEAGPETNATNEGQSTSGAAADADRRIAVLQRERDALAAEVGRLERRGDSTSPGQTTPPAPPQPAIPAERSDLEPSLAAASLPDGMPARVLIRYLRDSPDARRRAENLAAALAREGVEVADFRGSAGAVRTELSFSYAPDEEIALRVGRLAGVAPVRRPQPNDALMARPGTVELSLSGDSHLAAIATSRKERSHE